MSYWRGMRAATAIGFAVGCNDASTEPRQSIERLKVIASPVTTDTVEAQPVQAVVAAVRTATGELATGVVVQFEVLPFSPTNAQPSMGLRALSSEVFGEFVAVESDARGLAEAQVRYGTAAGAGRITLSVPELGIVDTLTFTVTAGAAARVSIAPKDTVVHIGTTTHFRGGVVDRFGNSRTDPVTFSSSADPVGVGSVDGSGNVTSAGAGQVTVIVATATAADTAHLFAVPVGEFAAFDQGAGNFVVADFDGTIIDHLSPSALNGLEVAWSPNGGELATGPVSPNQLQILHLDGRTETLTWTPGNGLGDPYWPAYSPDGQYIYFSSGAPDGIWRVTRDGSRVEQVHAGLDYRPSLSPDGQAVTFHTVAADGFTVVVRIYDVVAQQLVGSDVPGRFPEWGPGTSGIAFMENNTNRIMVMAANGTGARFLTPPGHVYFDDQLAWSPDGRWILARGGSGLELINSATGQIVPLQWTFNLYEPAWRPTTGHLDSAVRALGRW